MIVINSEIGQYTEVLKPSDKVCMEQEFVPELSLAKSLIIHRSRRFAYCIMDDHDRKAHRKKSFWTTLRLCGDSYSHDDGIPSHLLSQRLHNIIQSLSVGT